MTTKRAVDWPAIEADLRAGALSNRQIAEKHGLSESAIRKRATAEGWVRSKVPKVRTRRESAHHKVAHSPAPARRALAPPVEATGNHADLGRDIALRMLSELDAATAHADELEKMIEVETTDDSNGRRREAMMKAVSLSARATTLKTIAQALGAMKETEAEKGKKELRKDAAKAAATGGGRFAMGAPPKLVVNNNRGK